MTYAKEEAYAITVYALLVVSFAFAALKFSPHPIAWLIGVTSSIPVFAAMLGGQDEAS